METAGLKNVKTYKTDAASIIRDSLCPVLSDIVTMLDSVKAGAGDDAGVWHLPDGENFYEYCLKYHTTTSLSPDEIFNLGVSEVARIQHEIRIRYAELGIDTMLKFKEITWTYWNSLEAGENSSLLFLSANSPEILKHYNELIEDAVKRSAGLFNQLPSADVRAEAIPEYKRKSIGAHYEPAYLDSKRDGVFFADIYNDAYIPGMASLTYHETVPGHHLQITLEQEFNKQYMFRNLFFFTGYVEGWALYAEKLAYEQKWHKDLYSEIEYLFSELFRAVRLVVDTGIHKKKWTRERAYSYMESSMGWGSYNEIDRYIVWPGQACSYKIWELKIIELRNNVSSVLKENFNIKDFNSAVVRHGAMPLEILENTISEFIIRAK